MGDIGAPDLTVPAQDGAGHGAVPGGGSSPPYDAAAVGQQRGQTSATPPPFGYGNPPAAVPTPPASPPGWSLRRLQAVASNRSVSGQHSRASPSPEVGVAGSAARVLPPRHPGMTTSASARSLTPGFAEAGTPPLPVVDEEGSAAAPAGAHDSAGMSSAQPPRDIDPALLQHIGHGVPYIDGNVPAAAAGTAFRLGGQQHPPVITNLRTISAASRAPSAPRLVAMLRPGLAGAAPQPVGMRQPVAGGSMASRSVSAPRAIARPASARMLIAPQQAQPTGMPVGVPVIGRYTPPLGDANSNPLARPPSVATGVGYESPEIGARSVVSEPVGALPRTASQRSLQAQHAQALDRAYGVRSVSAMPRQHQHRRSISDNVLQHSTAIAPQLDSRFAVAAGQVDPRMRAPQGDFPQQGPFGPQQLDRHGSVRSMRSAVSSAMPAAGYPPPGPPIDSRLQGMAGDGEAMYSQLDQGQIMGDGLDTFDARSQAAYDASSDEDRSVARPGSVPPQQGPGALSITGNQVQYDPRGQMPQQSYVAFPGSGISGGASVAGSSVHSAGTGVTNRSVTSSSIASASTGAPTGTAAPATNGSAVNTVGQQQPVPSNGGGAPAGGNAAAGTKSPGKGSVTSDDQHSKKSEDDDSGDEDELEEFKFVRKTLPKSAFSHEELRAEFRCLDYSPLVNVRPVDLSEPLRPTKASRKLRMFICITCYNEDGDELRRTLHGIASNLPKLAKRGLHWSELAVCVLIDGREAASPSMLDFLQYELKLYDPGVLRTVHQGRPVVMHLFERTLELVKHSTQREYFPPLQCMLALKERNGGKLNSHLWFFSGFSVQLNPKYCALIDVGTVPKSRAIVRLWESMENDPTIGGVCGEITIRSTRPWHFLDAAQTFEYKVSHVMDKACESVFGYISVLPGAFSAYRWVAIRGEPLCAYFTIEEMAAKDMGPFVANMYLAEDRILCFEILARRHRKWLLRYVSGAVAETDAPQTLLELVKQRRRWLNGSLFALLYYLYHFPRFLRTRHSVGRKLLFFIQFIFLLSSTALAWFAPGTLFLSYMLIFNQAISNLPFGETELRMLFTFVYCALLFLQIIAGMAGKVNSMASIYVGVAVSYAVLMCFSIMLGVWLVVTNGITPFVGLGFACSLFAYLFAAFLHGSLFRSSLMFVQYLLLLPLSVNVFPIYSFTNLHDISWGTKEGNLQAEQRRAHQGRAERAIKKAQKAREAIERLQLEQARKQREAEELALRAQRQALLAAAGIYLPESELAAAANAASQGDAIKATAAAQVGLTLKGGTGMMKVIDEDNAMAGYVDVSGMKRKDVLLDMRIDRALDLQARLGMLPPDNVTQKLIRDAKQAAKLHAEAAVREKRIADEMALDKARMQVDFNFFRMRMLCGWVLCNALLVLLVSNYDTNPPLGGYATYTTITVIYMIGIKMLGSMIFQVSRAMRWCFRGACRCCYRLEESRTGTTRLICCSRPKDYYYLDDMWEDEHGYEHQYPDTDEGVKNDGMTTEQQNLVAAAKGLALGGYAPDGTPLYYAPDGTGPLDCNAAPIDALAVGFQLGPNGELLLPDGSTADVGVVWVDDAGNAVELVRDATGQPVLDEHGNPIPVASQQSTYVEDSGMAMVPYQESGMQRKPSAASMTSVGTVRTVATDLTHAVRYGDLPAAPPHGAGHHGGQYSGNDLDADSTPNAAEPSDAGSARRVSPIDRRRRDEHDRTAAALAAARAAALSDVHEVDEEASAEGATTDRSLERDDEHAVVNVSAQPAGPPPAAQHSHGGDSGGVSVSQVHGRTSTHGSANGAHEDRGQVSSESVSPSDAIGGSTSPPTRTAGHSGVQTKGTSGTSNTGSPEAQPAHSVALKLVPKSQLLRRKSATAGSGGLPSQVARSGSTLTPHSTTAAKHRPRRWSNALSRLPRGVTRSHASQTSSDSSGDEERGGGQRVAFPSRRASIKGSLADAAAGSGAIDAAANGEKPAVPAVAEPVTIVRVHTAPKGRTKRHTRNDTAAVVRGSFADSPAVRSGATDLDVTAVAIRGGGAQGSNLKGGGPVAGANLLGFTDPVTGRWIRPQPQGESVDEYDEDDDESAESDAPPPPPEPRQSTRAAGQRTLRPAASGTPAAAATTTRQLSRGISGTPAAGATPSRSTASAGEKKRVAFGNIPAAPPPADAETVALDNLLKDAEASCIGGPPGKLRTSDSEVD